MVQFLQQTLAPAYEQYFTEAVERPLAKQRAKTLQELYRQQAMRGILGSGVGMYPVIELERSIADVLGREGARLALAQAQTQTQLEEAERQRAFQRELLERQIQLQRQILDEQRRLAEQQAWGQLLGTVLGTVVMPPLGALGTTLATGLTRVIAPSIYAREQALQEALLNYWRGLPTGYGTVGYTPTQPLTAGVNLITLTPQYGFYYQPQPVGSLVIK